MTNTHKNRVTGNLQTVGRADDMGLDSSSGAWVTVCEPHGTIANSATRRLAEAANGLDFCDECRAEAQAASASEPTAMERDAARNIGAPVGQTPRYSAYATLTYLAPEGWFVIWGSEVTPYGQHYADALAAWEQVANQAAVN